MIVLSQSSVEEVSKPLVAKCWEDISEDYSCT